MREIDVSAITGAVAKLCKDANFITEPDLTKALENALEKEESPTAKEIIK